MARQIRINPGALRNAAQRYNQIADILQDSGASVRSQASRLGAAWDSNAGDRAAAALITGAGMVNQIAQAVSANAGRLSSIAEAFENADESSGGSVVRLDRNLINAVAGFTGRSFAPGLDIEAGGHLSVETYALRSVASRCGDEADRLWDLSRNLESTAETLGSDWEGRAYERYAEDTQVIAAALRKCADSFRSTAERISYAAYRYEEMDEALI